MGAVSVKFNNNTLSPTPTVSRNYQFLDYSGRFGQVEQIDLNSYVTGITTSKSATDSLMSIFSGQFKTLEVLEDATSIYKWDNVVVQEISIPNNGFPIGGFTPYNVKLVSYQIPSGVLDPSNEYSFSQNGDGTVSVNHKISAKGVRNANGALDNAIAFVKGFVRQNPFSACAPAFIPNSVGVLSNVSESIDRASCSYSVTEIYKYSTGFAVTGYLQTESLSLDDSKINDYTTLDLSVKLQGSPIDDNISEVRAAANALDVNSVLQSYGLLTTGIFRNSFSISEQTGENLIEIKTSFISGISGPDYSGYFDYTVSMDKDFVNSVSNWKVDGEFLVKGPISFRQSRVANFKTNNQANKYVPYLSGLITGSALWQELGEYDLTSIEVNLSENTGLGTLKLNCSFSNFDTAYGLIQPKYSVESEPQKWIYNLIPAANIEGHYVVQDLQVKSQAKTTLAANAGTTGTKLSDILNISGILDTLSGIYIGKQAYQTSENLTSGITNIEYQKTFLGEENQGSSLLSSKVYGSFGNEYVRPKGFQFGY